MRLIFIGDIFGEPGRKAVQQVLPGLVRDQKIDFVVANGENVAHGRGVTAKTLQSLLSSGVHVVTTGNHAFDQQDALNIFSSETRLLRPYNYSSASPGKGFVVVEVFSGIKIAVVNLIGRIHMEPADCPFEAADAFIKEVKHEADILFVDMHAEATSEMRAMGWYLDGRVAAVLGSHTHVQTADEEILPKGTAYLSDAGMTGPYRSVIGMKIEPILQKMTLGLKSRFEPADGDVRFCAALVEIEESTGLAKKIERVQIRL